jgi:hypothetical protein
LEIIPPPGGGVPWLIDTPATSKKIYMDNFPAGGEYQVVVAANAGDGTALCSSTLTFQKGALLIPGQPIAPYPTGEAAATAEGIEPTPTLPPPYSDESTEEYGGCTGCVEEPDVIVK